MYDQDRDRRRVDIVKEKDFRKLERRFNQMDTKIKVLSAKTNLLIALVIASGIIQQFFK